MIVSKEYQQKYLIFRNSWLKFGKHLPNKPWQPQSWSFYQFNYNADKYYALHPKRRKKITE